MKQKGFTLIELLVVIAIIGLLASIALYALNVSRSKSRDAIRKHDLKDLQTALELYYYDHHQYPCSGVNADPCADAGLNFRSSDAADNVIVGSPGNYIPGLAPTYIPKLPDDPLGGSASGFENPPCDTGSWHRAFVYISNGKDYKLMSHCAPENPWTSSDPFYDEKRPTWAWVVSSPGAPW